jgi:DNA polymerase-3 subunit alpha
MTDHGTLANAVAFWSACDEAEIKPILGMEAYLLYEGRRHHLTLLSLNEEGFNNLVHLDTESHTERYIGGYPLITLDALHKRNSGLVALTGCASSAIYHGEYEDALRYAGDLTETLGKENVLAEVMFVGTHDTWTRPLEIARRLGLGHVITNDSHYPCREQFAAHQAICTARKGFTYDSQQLWLKSWHEIVWEGQKFVGEDTVHHGLINTLGVADKVDKWSMKSPPSLPFIPEVEERLTQALRSALIADVEKKGQQKQRLARLRSEFRILHEKKFLDYIFILWDIVSWAKRQGIVVGPGRGSGGGSYVLYLLGITTVDPLEFGLIFERFINPARADYPDVDVDFESDRRQEVMNYAADTWGTIPIATYACYSHKSAIHDIARVLHIPKDLELPAADSARESANFDAFIDDKPEALSTYNTMLGQIRHRGKHAAGVIIPNRPVPIERAGDELVAAWAEGMNTKDLSKVGIVKYDILG